MADKLVPSKDDMGAVRRFRDMGDGTFAEVLSIAAGAAGAAGYPAGATPVNAFPAQVANAACTATLPAAVGKTTYLAGVDFSGAGATASGVAGMSISGLLGGTLLVLVPVPAGSTVSITPGSLRFNPPIPASGVNVAISAVLSAFGAGNAAAVCSAYGYQL